MTSFAERQASRLLQEDDQFLLLQLSEVRERFEEKVIPEPNSGCHLWMAAAGGPSGHGMSAILSNFDVETIRRSGLDTAALANQYQVSKTAIHAAKTGSTFGHLPGAIPVTPKHCLTKAEREEIILSKEPTGQLARRMRVAGSTVCRLRGPFMRPRAAAALSATLRRTGLATQRRAP